YGRTVDRDPPHMQLKDDRFFPGDLRTTILAPSEGGLDDPAFWDLAGIVAAVERQIRPLTAYAVAKQRIAPPQPAVQRFGIGIDQQLVGVKAVPIRRIVWSVDAVAVKEVRASIRQVSVPDFIGVFRKHDPRLLAVPRAIEQA